MEIVNKKNPPKHQGITNHEPLYFLITVLEDHRGHAMLARSALSIS
jgi:hypothetical protein